MHYFPDYYTLTFKRSDSPERRTITAAAFHIVRRIINMKETVILCFISILAVSCTAYKSTGWQPDIFSDGGISNMSSGAVNDARLLMTSAPVTLKSMKSGELESSTGDMIDLSSPGCSGIGNETIRVPVYAFLIVHPEYGTFLIDTGCCEVYAENPYGPMRGILFPHVMSKTFMEPGEAIEKQLQTQGINMSGIRGVFFTHLHFDHTSGLPVLPRPMVFVAGKGESSLSIPLLLKPKHFRKGDTIHFLDFSAGYAADSGIGRVIDIFGDGSVWAISTPGHSKGHVSYLVNTTGGPVLIAGDALMDYRSIELGAGPGKCLDSRDRAEKSFSRLTDFIRKHPDVRLLAGHDYPE